MADENNSGSSTQQGAGATAQPQQAPEPKAQGDDLERWKQMSRKNERDAKKALADLAASQEAQAKAEGDLAAANERIAALEAAAAHEQAIREVAASEGLPEAVVRGLRGETAEELVASAALLKANYSAYPLSRDKGDPKPPATTRESIEAIKDPAERVRQRAKNIGLYE